MKSLREYIEIINEAGPMTWAVDQEVTRGMQSKAPGAQQHPLEIGKTRAPVTPAPVKPTAADFDQWRQQPSAAQLKQPAVDPMAAVFPASAAGTTTTGAGASKITPQKKVAAATAATATPTAKTTASYSGAKYGYNSPEEIQQIQSQLNTMGYNIAVDGKWGPKTQDAYMQAYGQMYGQKPGQTDPNAPVPQNYQQGKAEKKGLSKDMAAAVGIPNPNVSTPSASKQALLAKAAEFTKAGDTAKAKIYTDAAARMSESTELDRIKTLFKY